MKNKTPIITPENYLKQTDINNIKFNGLCHVFFNNTYLNYFGNYDLEQIFKLKSFNIYSFQLENQKVFLAIIRNGSSLSSIDFECLIHLGFTEFIFYGFAGSINCSNIGDILLIEKAFIGEGVSQYYTKNRKYNYTSKPLNKQIMDKLDNHFQIKTVNCYTTDALFMETKELIDDLKCLEVECIDMECSALTSISHFRKVNATFIFCVSDILRENEWECNKDIDLRNILVNTLISLYTL